MSDERARGHCPDCGHHVAVNQGGFARRHQTRRIQTGPGGKPEIYRTETDCPGSGHSVEPIGELVAELHRERHGEGNGQ